MADYLPLILALELLDDSEVESSDVLSEDDDIKLFSVASCYMRRNLNRVCDYVEGTIPLYFPDEFKNHFRMTRRTCELFTRAVMPTGMIPLGNGSGRAAIPPLKQVLDFLWSMANQEPARVVADRFDITMSSVDRVLKRVSQAAIHLSGQFIRWSNGELVTVQNKLKINLPLITLTIVLKFNFTANDKLAIRTSFEDEGEFPDVIGLIDGTHIRIRAPEDDPDAYIERKKFFSLNVQVKEKHNYN